METGERCVGNFTIDESLKRAYKETHIEYVELKEIDPETFFESIAEAKKINFFGPFVERRSKDDYRTMQLFTTLDDSAGIAITKEGNIVSVFSKGIHKGVLKTLIPVALSRGGKKLDNFDSERLSAMYASYGFIPISRTSFDKNFAPKDWDYEAFGQPDIVFWLHNGDSAESVIYKFGEYKVDMSKTKKCLNYEEAEKFRDNILKRLEER